MPASSNSPNFSGKTCPPIFVLLMVLSASVYEFIQHRTKPGKRCKSTFRERRTPVRLDSKTEDIATKRSTMPYGISSGKALGINTVILLFLVFIHFAISSPAATSPALFDMPQPPAGPAPFQRVPYTPPCSSDAMSTEIVVSVVSDRVYNKPATSLAETKPDAIKFQHALGYRGRRPDDDIKGDEAEEYLLAVLQSKESSSIVEKMLDNRFGPIQDYNDLVVFPINVSTSLQPASESPSGQEATHPADPNQPFSVYNRLGSGARQHSKNAMRDFDEQFKG